MIKWKFCLRLPSCLLWFVNLRDTPLCVKQKPYLLASQRSPEVGAGRQGWVVSGTSLSISVRSSGVLGSSWGRRGEEMRGSRVKRDQGRFDLSFCSFPQICLQSVLQKNLEKWLDSEHNLLHHLLQELFLYQVNSSPNSRAKQPKQTILVWRQSMRATCRMVHTLHFHTCEARNKGHWHNCKIS